MQRPGGTWIQILALPPTWGVTVGKLLMYVLAGHYLPHL